MKYPFYEDLTRATFKQLKTIQPDKRVPAAWMVGGIIRFKLEGDERIHKVTSIYDTIDDILEELKVIDTISSISHYSVIFFIIWGLWVSKDAEFNVDFKNINLP
jgi:hypothetical protein